MDHTSNVVAIKVQRVPYLLPDFHPSPGDAFNSVPRSYRALYLTANVEPKRRSCRSHSRYVLLPQMPDPSISLLSHYFSDALASPHSEDIQHPIGCRFHV
jgi:hypothetical protein